MALVVAAEVQTLSDQKRVVLQTGVAVSARMIKLVFDA